MNTQQRVVIGTELPWCSRFYCWRETKLDGVGCYSPLSMPLHGMLYFRDHSTSSHMRIHKDVLSIIDRSERQFASEFFSQLQLAVLSCPPGDRFVYFESIDSAIVFGGEARISAEIINEVVDVKTKRS